MKRRILIWLAGVLTGWLTAVMARLHGQTWRATVDHASGFVLIQHRRG
jgi:hypothetical protein